MTKYRIDVMTIPVDKAIASAYEEGKTYEPVIRAAQNQWFINTFIYEENNPQFNQRDLICCHMHRKIKGPSIMHRPQTWLPAVSLLPNMANGLYYCMCCSIDVASHYVRLIL